MQLLLVQMSSLKVCFALSQPEFRSSKGHGLINAAEDNDGRIWQRLAFLSYL